MIPLDLHAYRGWLLEQEAFGHPIFGVLAGTPLTRNGRSLVTEKHENTVRRRHGWGKERSAGEIATRRLGFGANRALGEV